MRSSTDIVSISTGRETILIGPLSAFGAQAASTVLRDRFSIIQTLDVFAGRPNAEQLIRPHLRRWGVDSVSLRVATRQTLVHALARLASNGSIGIAKVPEVTLSFAGASLDEDFKQASVKPITDASLPPDLSDRMMLVFDMVPEYMEGETRLAFEKAVNGPDKSFIVGAVVAWIGAHFVPGVNIAMLAFDMFFLSASVLHALERAHEIVCNVRDAKSRAELKPAAIAMAAVLSTLIVEGVLGRLLKAKNLTKGVGKKGGHSDAKPSLGKKEAKKSKEAERVRERDTDTGGAPPKAVKTTAPPQVDGKGAMSPTRREQLNKKFGRVGDVDRDINRRQLKKETGRTGNLDQDINRRQRMKTAEDFYRQSGMPEREIPGHMKGIDFDQDVRVETLNGKKTLHQYQVPGNNQGGYYSPTGKVSPSDLGIHDKGVVRNGPDAGAIKPKELKQYTTTQKTKVLRSTAAPIKDNFSVKGQSFPTKGGARQMYIPRDAGVVPKGP